MSVICDPVQSRTVAHPCFPVYKARCAARRRASKRIDNTIVALQFVSNIRFQIRTIYAEYRQEIGCQVCVCVRVFGYLLLLAALYYGKWSLAKLKDKGYFGPASSLIIRIQSRRRAVRDRSCHPCLRSLLPRAERKFA